ncbi:hypothetical protein [Coralloluteibacterium stylophorae]|uniref:Uncharacterized protein n=1 Tax=Coralloluteibacterium stylophorae TaxID=1776034 RepID=A0A8J7VSR5_9GAMM|nr:hypothetical protein [Coralloluteibacterium stylophorae]MBS7456309.1 hypothetical protein [Coralloluteibacterium stylophorae]
MNTFPVLLRREYWEHRGGFVWAPVIAGIVVLVLTLMAWVLVEVAARGSDVQIGGVDLAALSAQMSAQERAEAGQALDVATALIASWPLLVMAFVVFFYSLGALYDDRRDRSVLFWKSLPVSDLQTVLSKAVSALVLVPVFATVVGVLTGLGLLLLVSLAVAVHGGNPFALVWGLGSPFRVGGLLLASLPVYVLWALPTVGWLLLVSAWARGKPFLWAVLIPLFSGILVGWLALMSVIESSGWYWKHIVARLTLGTFPGMDLLYRGDLAEMASAAGQSPEGVLSMLSLANTAQALRMPDLWIGAVAGVAMIAVAVWLRGRRDEG